MSDFKRAVQQIAHQVSHSGEPELPLLLQLYPIVSSSKITLREMKEVKQLIWMSDLLHVIVEILRQDFSVIEGSWETAQKLAFILSSVSSSLYPHKECTEQAKEFHDILLPTIIDSTLILATNTLEVISNDTHESLSCFTNVLHSLTEVCSSHHWLVLRVLQSPYLLHMLISDHNDAVEETLKALATLLKLNLSCLHKLPLETLYSIMDELVYKISGTCDRTALQSVDILALITSLDSKILDLVITRYSDLQATVRKWEFRNLEAVTKVFVEHIDSISSRNHRNMETQAAVVIQASWRGYSTRRRMKRAYNGIQRFQQLYRKWKAQKKEAERTNRKAKDVQSKKENTMKRNKIAYWESQLALVKQLPSNDMPAFIMKQKVNAATKIQSQWRAYIAKKKYCHLHQSMHLQNSAITIQRAVRRHIEKKRSELATHGISAPEKESLKSDINKFRMARGQKHLSTAEQKQLHEQVQGMLEEFYLSMPAQNRLLNQQKILLSQLERSSSLLSSSPSLTEAFSNQGVANSFCSSSSQIAAMARIAHKEELKSFDIPWWKKPQSTL